MKDDDSLKEKEDEKEDVGFKISSLMDLVRKLGFIPYALVSLGVLTEIYDAKIVVTGKDTINDFLKLLSAVLFVSGILWALLSSA